MVKAQPSAFDFNGADSPLQDVMTLCQQAFCRNRDTPCEDATREVRCRLEMLKLSGRAEPSAQARIDLALTHGLETAANVVFEQNYRQLGTESRLGVVAAMLAAVERRVRQEIETAEPESTTVKMLGTDESDTDYGTEHDSRTFALQLRYYARYNRKVQYFTLVVAHHAHK